MSETMTLAELIQLKVQIEVGLQTLFDVCSGKKRWRMCVPVEPDDPDLLVADGLAAGQKAADALSEMLAAADARPSTVPPLWRDAATETPMPSCTLPVVAIVEFNGRFDVALDVWRQGQWDSAGTKLPTIRYWTLARDLLATLPAAGAADVAATDEEGGHREHA